MSVVEFFINVPALRTMDKSKVYFLLVGVDLVSIVIFVAALKW